MNHPTLSVAEILGILRNEGIDAQTSGNPSFEVVRLRHIEQTDPSSLSFFVGSDANKLGSLKTCVVLTLPTVSLPDESVICIHTEHPKLAFYILAQRFQPPSKPSLVHKTAVIDSKSTIHPSAYIGPYCVIEESQVGENAVLEAHVTLMGKTKIGANVVIEANTCIGATGQGFAWGLDGKRWVMPQIGGTTIGDNTFIGANITIVRGTLQDTRIGKDCRIAHGSRIGHNCQIGNGTFVANQVAIPGSVKIGEKCFLGSGSVFRPGVCIGESITVGAGSVVTRDVNHPGAVLVGTPARMVKTSRTGEKLSGVPSGAPLKDKQ